jgi:hypothetical protein
MIADIGPRPGLNFPTATAEQWQAARRHLIAWLVRHDVDRERAEEIAQEVLADFLTRTWVNRSPINPRVAAAWRIATAKRFGVGSMTRAGRRSDYRRRAGLEEAQPAADPVAVRDAAPGWTDPARMAAAGEAIAERMPRLAARARSMGTTPAGLAMLAAGWGWGSEGGTVPTVTGSRPGPTLQAQGAAGVSTATDPNPAARGRAWAEAVAHAADRGLAVTSRHR